MCRTDVTLLHQGEPIREPIRQFADLDLSRRLERAEGRSSAAFVEARAASDAASGACWRELAGAYAMFDGPGSPITQTFGLGLFEPVVAASLDELEEFFFDRKADVDHEISPLAQKDLVGLLVDRGYRPIEYTNVLYIAIAEYRKPDVVDNIEVRKASADQIPLWAAVAAQGWASVGEFTGLMQLVASIPCVYPFFAKINGFPIATAALNIQDDVALLAGGSTIPEGRHRGAQRALLQARLWHAEGLGCQIAMMGAEPGSSSQRNAEREGFRIAYTRIKWRRKFV